MLNITVNKDKIFEYKEENPFAVLELPVVFNRNASVPKAELLLPEMLKKNN